MIELFKAAFRFLFEATEAAARAYIHAFKKFITFAVIAVLISVPILFLGVFVGERLLIALSVSIVGLVLVLGLIVSFPALWVTQTALEKFPAFRKSVLFVLNVLFWLLVIALYFYVVPIWQRPQTVPLVLLLILIIAVGSVAFGTRVVNPKAILILMVLILMGVTRLFFFPENSRSLGMFISRLDEKINQGFRNWLTYPRAVDPEKVRWFGPAGEPLIYFCVDDDGNYRFYDRKGTDPYIGNPLEPVTIQVRKDWMEWKKKKALFNSPPPPSADGRGNEAVPAPTPPPQEDRKNETGSETTPKPQPSPPLHTQEEVVRFVEDFLRLIQLKDRETLLTFFQDPVSYFDKGYQSLEFVRRDFGYYFRQWTRIQYQLTEPVRIISERPEQGEVTVSYRMEFDVENEEKRSSGLAETRLRIQKTAQGLKIAEITQKILRRKIESPSETAPQERRLL